MDTNIMVNQVKTPIQNYFEKVLYEIFEIFEQAILEQITQINCFARLYRIICSKLKYS